uniref:Uncharacterized protein n=1 Tax=Nelumbo nucifera TaxID=4432 RepID=A0A822XZX3_NELNU|nr:TPA_asm: hypothetical protein HUJ06_026053 [Nelumbo nucifera]
MAGVKSVTTPMDKNIQLIYHTCPLENCGVKIMYWTVALGKTHQPKSDGDFIFTFMPEK